VRDRERDGRGRERNRDGGEMEKERQNRKIFTSSFQILD
jgi:hypothetical protein